MDRKAKGGLSRRTVLAGAAAGVVAPVAVASAAGSSLAAAAGLTRQLTLYADYLPGTTRVGYGLEPGKPTIPGPLLEMYEGDTFEIELVNNTDQRLSIHPHGVLYDTESDGSPFNNSFNNPGETKTYTWRTRAAYQAANGLWMPGSAGYWHYHDHAFGGDHGTVGLMKGLYGGLIVRKRGDLLPAKTFTVVFTEMWINHQTAPDTPIFEANLGQRVEFLCIGHGNLMHTFHLHAHRWADTRTGMLTSATDNAPVIDNKTLDPGNSFGFQVIAGDVVGAGAWMYHCHVQQHSDDGMSGVFLVRNADGGMPAGAQDAIDRFKEHHHGTASAEPPTAPPPTVATDASAKTAKAATSSMPGMADMPGMDMTGMHH